MEAWEHISIGSFEAEAPRTHFLWCSLLAQVSARPSTLEISPDRLLVLVSGFEAYTIKPPGKSWKTIARSGWGTGCSAISLPIIPST
jgi:hypothetical protein